MSGPCHAEMNPQQPVIYQIRVRGHLGHHWSDWFEGLTLTALDDGDTLLTGPLADQAVLYGVLKKVRDLGVPLISVNRVRPGRAGMSDAGA